MCLAQGQSTMTVAWLGIEPGTTGFKSPTLTTRPRRIPLKLLIKHTLWIMMLTACTYKPWIWNCNKSISLKMWRNDVLFGKFNPFPHIYAFWRHCSRRLFENIVTTEEIAQNEQFLLLPQRFPLLVIGYPFNYRLFFHLLTKYVQSRLLQNCRMRERV